MKSKIFNNLRGEFVLVSLSSIIMFNGIYLKLLIKLPRAVYRDLLDFSL